MTRPRKKLIEVALPLDAINEAAVRAGLFAQRVDDPSAHPDLFPTDKKRIEVALPDAATGQAAVSAKPSG